VASGNAWNLLFFCNRGGSGLLSGGLWRLAQLVSVATRGENITERSVVCNVQQEGSAENAYCAKVDKTSIAEGYNNTPLSQLHPYHAVFTTI